MRSSLSPKSPVKSIKIFSLTPRLRASALILIDREIQIVYKNKTQRVKHNAEAQRQLKSV